MVEIVPYERALKKQIVELQTQLWSPDLSLNASYFNWKYEQNPYVKEPLIYLAVLGGKVIGMRGFFGVQWECGAPVQRFTSLYADDIVVAPAHRNRGIMSKIMSFALEDLTARGYQYVFNLSAGPLTLQSSLSMGWRSAGWVRPMLRRSWRTVLRQRGVLRYMQTPPVLSKRLACFASRRLATLNRSLEDIDLSKITRSLKHAPALSIEAEPRCWEMADLVSQIAGSGRIRHVRDSEYFRWRFRNPLSRYRYIFLENGHLDAYLILQEYTSEYANRSVFNIVDWESSSEEAREHLLEVACAVFAKERDLVIWSATLSEPTIGCLRKNGFRFLKPPKNVTHFPTAILVRAIAESGGEWMLGDRRLLDLAAWDLHMLYSMAG